MSASPDDEDDESFFDPEEPVEIPITGELDLHTFRPSDLGGLLPDYFHECRERGILEVRVIHGKGTGTLRETVRRHLEKSEQVISFRTGDETEGSWGATMVNLRPKKSLEDGN
ncbi:MAG: Smr/MutS family protein [Verrucomicrobiota bacterium]